MRWLTVGPPGQPEVNIVLHPPGADPGVTDDERRIIREMMAKGTYASILLATADLDATFDHLQAAGVDIVQEPIEQFWGVRDCAVRDPAGNMVRIQEVRKAVEPGIPTGARGRRPGAAAAFYARAFDLGDAVRFRQAEGESSGFRGYSISLIASQPQRRRRAGGVGAGGRCHGGEAGAEGLLGLRRRRRRTGRHAVEAGVAVQEGHQARAPAGTTTWWCCSASMT